MDSTSLARARATQGHMGVFREYRVFCDWCTFVTAGFETEDQATARLERHIQTEGHGWRYGDGTGDPIARQWIEFLDDQVEPNQDKEGTH